MENAHLYDDGDEFDECTNEFYTYKHEALGKWKAGDLVGSFDLLEKAIIVGSKSNNHATRYLSAILADTVIEYLNSVGQTQRANRLAGIKKMILDVLSNCGFLESEFVKAATEAIADTGDEDELDNRHFIDIFPFQAAELYEEALRQQKQNGNETKVADLIAEAVNISIKSRNISVILLAYDMIDKAIELYIKYHEFGKCNVALRMQVLIKLR